jgi:hypothetical protein
MSQQFRLLADETVGGIEKEDVDPRIGGWRVARIFEPSKQIAGMDAASFRYAQDADILAQSIQGRSIGFEEIDECRSSAETFQSHAACPRKTIRHPAIRQQGGQDIEKRLLDPIGDGTRDIAGRRDQVAATKFAGDDAHGIQSSEPMP